MRQQTPLGEKLRVGKEVLIKISSSKSSRFVGQSSAAMEQHTGRCEEAIATRQPAKMVDNTSSIAR